MPRPLTFSSRLLIQQILVILFVVLLAAGVFGWLSYQRLVAEIGAKALAVSQTVAENDTVQDVLQRADGVLPGSTELAAGPVQDLAEEIRLRTGALFVVVADVHGLRWAHPNPAELGQRVSTSPDEALAGKEVVETDLGSLGSSVRAKVPIRGSDGAIIGEVSVGFATSEILDDLWGAVGPILAVSVIALALGAIGTSFLMRSLRRHTLGLELEEIGALVQNQEVVLHGVAEGVIGLDADKRVTICNDKAAELLGLTAPEGTLFDQLGLPEGLVTLLEHAHLDTLDGEQQDPAESVQIVLGRSVLLANALKVVRGKHDLGWVVMVRDRTSVQALSRQLDAVSTLTSALRAQRHEFANRLHAVVGLIDIGRSVEAADYVRSTLETGPLRFPLENGQLLSDTYLLAFLGAKSTQAAERGVQLRLGAETSLHSQLQDAQNTTTVLGNLVDNAITAAVHGESTERWVEVELLSDGSSLHLTVADSGDGVPAALVDQLFDEGFSTSALHGAPSGLGEGLGLALSRQLARLDGGEVRLLSPGRVGGPGAVFLARLEQVLTETVKND